MPVPFNLEFGPVIVKTEVTVETANKIALGLAGVAASLAVVAAGAALRASPPIVKVGVGLAAAGALGIGAAAAALTRPSDQEQLTDAPQRGSPGDGADRG